MNPTPGLHKLDNLTCTVSEAALNTYMLSLTFKEALGTCRFKVTEIHMVSQIMFANTRIITDQNMLFRSVGGRKLPSWPVFRVAWFNNASVLQSTGRSVHH